ncbi:MAG TPA: NYN domain-containing protein, partial [Gemmatimonadota bacterium]|nr:NYN domain-containing protein [Gemmatimonadota bacterium]
MPEAVLVDGYNVLHAIPRFAPRGGDVAAARQALERWLAEAAARHGVVESVIVWDGRDRAGSA